MVQFQTPRPFPSETSCFHSGELLSEGLFHACRSILRLIVASLQPCASGPPTPGFTKPHAGHGSSQSPALPLAKACLPSPESGLAPGLLLSPSVHQAGENSLGPAPDTPLPELKLSQAKQARQPRCDPVREGAESRSGVRTRPALGKVQ